MLELTKIGPIKSIKIPQDWKRKNLRLHLSQRLNLPLITIVPLDNNLKDIEIGLFFRGHIETKDDSYNFKSLLNSLTHTVNEVSFWHKIVLSEKQIRLISKVIGLTGFNQYSYPKELSGFTPSFNLKTAEIESYDTKNVLAISGEFIEFDQIDTYYSAIFFPADKEASKIYEFYLQASNKNSFLAGLEIFQKILVSLVWEDELARFPKNTSSFAAFSLD